MSDNTEQPVIFERLALIGIGLIGSSIALAARNAGIVREISASARSEESRRIARELKLADRVTASNAEAAEGADLVILCTPVGSFETVMDEIAPVLAKGAILSDVGSVKGMVLDIVGPKMPDGVHLIPGHPVAGTEQSGPAAGFAELFHDRWCIQIGRAHV